MSDEKPSEMVFSERAYKVVLALNAEYGCNMEGQPATEIVELAIRAALRDCEDALAVFSHAYDNWKPGAQVPGLRFYNPEGEVVTYHLPPPREKSGPPINSPAERVRRDAGHIPAR